MNNLASGIQVIWVWWIQLSENCYYKTVLHWCFSIPEVYRAKSSLFSSGILLWNIGRKCGVFNDANLTAIKRNDRVEVILNSYWKKTIFLLNRSSRLVRMKWLYCTSGASAEKMLITVNLILGVTQNTFFFHAELKIMGHATAAILGWSYYTFLTWVVLWS